MQEYRRYMKLFILSTIGLFFFLGCNDSKGGEPNTPSIITPTVELNNSITEDEFNGDEIEKILPNGEKFIINTIEEIRDTPTVGDEKIYQTKINGVGDGFFVVNGDYVEGTFTKDGKSYNIGTFKDGQRITENQNLQNEGEILVPPLSESISRTKIISSPRAKIISSDSKPNVTILFVYNEDFWDWCDNDMTIVDNKLNAIIAYTNTAFSRSAINTTVSIAGREKITLVDDKILQETALINAQKLLELPNSNLSKFRDLHSADIVFIIRKEPIHQGFEDQGRAYYSIIKNETSLYKNINYAIGIQDIVMGDLGMSLFSHELGHIFGCAHDDKTRLEQSKTLEKNYNQYANGYWLEDLHWDNSYFTTLMGYGNSIQNYSNPNIDYEGVATGIEGDTYQDADCARFINFSAPLIADFRNESIIVPNTPPTANAGVDINIDEGENVTLDGSDSDGNIVSYEWTQLSGTSVEIQNSTAQIASFLAPSIGNDSVLEFKLEVTDEDGETSKDFVKVKVRTTKDTLMYFSGPINTPITNINLNTSIFSPNSSVSGAFAYTLKNIGKNPLKIFKVTYQGSNQIEVYGLDNCYNIILESNESTYECTPNFSHIPNLVGLHKGTVTVEYNDGYEKNIVIPVTLNVIAEELIIGIITQGFMLNRNPNNGVAGSPFLDYYSYRFESNQSDLFLQLSGYDIDIENEVCIYLNNTQLECLPTTLNEDYAEPIKISIPYTLQRDGSNSIELRQLNAGDLWGARDIEIF